MALERDFEVLKVRRADRKPDSVVAIVKYESNDIEYTYVRKVYSREGQYAFYVNGWRVYINEDWDEVLDYKFAYFAGKKKRTGNKTDKSVIESLKEEIEDLKNKNEEKELETEDAGDEKETDETNENEKDKVQASNKHEKYDMIKTCLQCNIPIYLAGPAGSGKNYTVEQIANELGWNFYFSNSVQQEYKLTGFIDAGGKFHETEFYKACMDEKDCIFFLDEMDASIPEVLVLLNAAIANGYFEFPNGRVNLKHVHFVAAGNTVGSGADEMYTGRMVLDQATLDRFAIIDFDYDMKVELMLSGDNLQLVEFVRKLREESKIKGIRTTFSYRCIMMVTKLEKAKMDIENILKIAVFKGLDVDTINTFDCNLINNKYSKAFKNIKRAA